MDVIREGIQPVCTKIVLSQNRHTVSGHDWLQNLRAPPNPNANPDMAIRSLDNHGPLVLHHSQLFAQGHVSWEAQDAVP